MLDLAPFRRYKLSTTKEVKTTLPSFEPPIEGTPSNFVVKLTMLKTETFAYHAAKTAYSYPRLFCHNTLALQTDDRHTDRQHTMTIAELSNVIATLRSAKNSDIFFLFIVLQFRIKFQGFLSKSKKKIKMSVVFSGVCLCE